MSSYISPKYVSAQIAGESINFYPVSVRTAFAMRSVAKPLAKALTVLFSPTDSDGSYHESSKVLSAGAEENAGYSREESKNREAVALPTIEMRLRTKQAAIEDLIEAITSDQNRGVIGMLLMDSMREKFPNREKMDSKTSGSWLDTVDVLTFKEMLVALAQANKEVLGPLGEKLSTITNAVVDSALASANPQQTSSPEKETTGKS